MSKSFPGYTDEDYQDLPLKRRKLLCSKFKELYHSFVKEDRYKNESKIAIILRTQQKMYSLLTKSKTIDIYKTEALKAVSEN